MCAGKQLSTFDAESKNAKTQTPFTVGGGGGGGGRNQLSSFDAKSKNAEIQNSHLEAGGGGGWQCPTFDVESKFAKI